MSYCPSCGKYQGHLHLGWLTLGSAKIGAKDGVVHTEIMCESCGCISLVVRFEENADKSKLSTIVDMIRKLFGFKGSGSSGCRMVC